MLQQMDNTAPATKVLPFVKPSDELSTRQNLFSRHLKEVQRVEDQMADVMTKLSQWNTYFGLDQFGKPERVGGEEEVVYDEQGGVVPVQGPGQGPGQG